MPVSAKRKKLEATTEAMANMRKQLRQARDRQDVLIREEVENGTSVAELTRLLGMSRATVYSALYRAGWVDGA